MKYIGIMMLAVAITACGNSEQDAAVNESQKMQKEISDSGAGILKVPDEQAPKQIEKKTFKY